MIKLLLEYINWGLKLTTNTTKYITLIIVIISILPKLNLFTLPTLELDNDKILWNLQFYRLFTCYFIYKFDWTFVFMVWNWIRFSTEVEKYIFKNNQPEFIWYLVLQGGFCLIGGIIFSLKDMGYVLLYTLVGIWSYHFANENVMYFYKVHLPGKYMPITYIIFDIVMLEWVPIHGIVGLLSCLIFLYFDIKSTTQHIVNPLQTPDLMYKLFPGSNKKGQFDEENLIHND